MILMDLSQISHASLAAERSTSPNVPLEKNLLKHFILNSIRMNNLKFGREYGRTIICVDSSSWRYSYFPNYKAHRKAARAEDGDFWKTVFDTILEVVEILDQSSPYPVMRVKGAEADDCIAWMVRNFATWATEDDFGGFGQEEKKPEKILILSGDKDFQQLQVFPGVDQYSPTLKKFLKCPDPISFRMEHIARGDAGDGVPNVLSPDNSFVDKVRQTPITKKFIERFINGFDNPISIDAPINKDQFLANFSRNKNLIDLTEPLAEDMELLLSNRYKTITENPTGSLELLRQAFIANRMKNLLDVIGDFRNKG